jgi:hypothetical protein
VVSEIEFVMIFLNTIVYDVWFLGDESVTNYIHFVIETLLNTLYNFIHLLAIQIYLQKDEQRDQHN